MKSTLNLNRESGYKAMWRCRIVYLVATLFCLLALLVPSSISFAVDPIASPQATDWMFKAVSARKKQKWSEVVAYSTKAIQIESKAGRIYARAYVYRADAYTALEKYSLALADFRKIPKGREDYAMAQRRIKALISEHSPTPTPKPTPVPTIEPVKPTPTSGPVKEAPLPAFEVETPQLAPPAPFEAEAWLGHWRDRTPDLIPSHSKSITTLTANSEGKLVASGSWQSGAGGDVGEIALWNFDGHSLTLDTRVVSRWAFDWNGKGARPAYYGHFGRINALKFSPDSAILASGGIGGGITLWSSKGKPLRVLRDEQKLTAAQQKAAPIVALEWKIDEQGQMLLALDADAQIWRWRRSGNAEFKALASRSLLSSAVLGRNWVKEAAITPGGDYIAIGDGNGNLMVYITETGSRLTSFQNSRHQEMGRDGVAVSALEFDSAGNAIASANFAHVYLNAFKSKESLLPLAFDNKLVRLREQIGAICWLSPELILARTSKGFAILAPGRLKDATVAVNGAIVGELPATQIPATVYSIQTLAIPQFNAVIDAVPGSNGSALTVFDSP